MAKEKTPGEIKVAEFKKRTGYGKSTGDTSCGTCSAFIKVPVGSAQVSKCKQIGMFETDKSDVSSSGSCAAWHE